MSRPLGVTAACTLPVIIVQPLVEKSVHTHIHSCPALSKGFHVIKKCLTSLEIYFSRKCNKFDGKLSLPDSL